MATESSSSATSTLYSLSPASDGDFSFGVDTNDNRLHPRTRIIEDGLLMIPSLHILSKIYDISEGGLSFFFPAIQNPGASSTMRIMSCGSGYLINDIPFSIVSVCKPENLRHLELCQSVRYSVQFGDLSPDLKSKLRYFIENFSYIP